MALLYYPAVGAILMCEFPTCFAVPEMTKKRPVVVINPRIASRPDLVTVVPLSTTAPSPVLEHHCLIPARLMPKTFQAQGGDCWAKCDMLYTLSLSRLSLVQTARCKKTGKRQNDTARLDLEHIQKIRRGAAAALGITGILFE